MTFPFKVEPVFTSQGCCNKVLQTEQLKNLEIALAVVTPWIECWPVNQKVMGLIPSHGTYLGCGLGPWLGACERLGRGK